MQVLLRVEHHVIVLGLHQHLAAIGDGADAVILGKRRNPLARVQAHARTAGQLQMILCRGVVVLAGVVHL
ncbi:hypothetical protein D3C73_1558690 [compost metagenome]